MFRHYAPDSKARAATTAVQSKRCEYCRLRGHVKSECCRLIEKNKNTATYSTEEKKSTGAAVADAKESQSAYAFSAPWGSPRWLHIGLGVHRTHDSNVSGMINLSPSTRQIMVADCKTIVATQTGALVLKLRTGRKIVLERLLVVPALKTALISISTIAANGYSVEFEEEKCTVRKGHAVILEAERNGKLYLFSSYCIGSDGFTLSVVTDWHLALRHPSVDKLKAVSKIFPKLGIVARNKQCEACVKGKM
jgi:hypothetical protein